MPGVSDGAPSLKPPVRRSVRDVIYRELRIHSQRRHIAAVRPFARVEWAMAAAGCLRGGHPQDPNLSDQSLCRALTAGKRR
jgi:hypothetical protein